MNLESPSEEGMEETGHKAATTEGKQLGQVKLEKAGEEEKRQVVSKANSSGRRLDCEVCMTSPRGLSQNVARTRITPAKAVPRHCRKSRQLYHQVWQGFRKGRNGE